MLEIARTLTEKAKGFMGVDAVANDEAILFMNVGPHAGFHMRTVGCDLTIAALDEDYRVIGVSMMEAETGGYTTPSGTKHVLEGNSDLSSKLVVGEKPDWSLFGLSDREPAKKEAKKAQFDISAEMSKEIMRVRYNGSEDAPLSVTYLSEVVSPDFAVKEVNDENVCFEPKDAEADRKYYGADDVGPPQSKSVMEHLINQVLGDRAASFVVGKELLVKSSTLDGFKSTVLGEAKGVKMISAYKEIDEKENEVYLCRLDGMISVHKRRCGKTEENYLQCLQAMLVDVI